MAIAPEALGDAVVDQLTNLGGAVVRVVGVHVQIRQDLDGDRQLGACRAAMERRAL